MSAELIECKVKTLENQDKIEQAIAVCNEFLTKYPRNQRIKKKIRSLKFKSLQNGEIQGIPKENFSRKFAAGDYQSLSSDLSDILHLFPDSYFLWNLMGNCHLRMKSPHRAKTAFTKAIEINPAFSNAYVGLGDVYKYLQLSDKAVSYYLKALEREPGNLTALNNLGTLHSMAGQHEEAVRVLEKGHDASPENPVILHNLSAACRGLKNVAKAEEYLLETLRIAPNFVEARYDLGLMQALRGDLAAAVTSFETVLIQDPDHVSAKVGKLHQMAHMCDWRWVTEFAKLPSDFGVDIPGITPFPFLALEDDPLRQRSRSEGYAGKFAANLEKLNFARPIRQDNRLRVGYFSADFHEHATTHLMGGLFEQHDTDQFEIFSYSFGPRTGDPAQGRLMSKTKKFRDVGHLTATEIVEVARHDGLDIAVDLKGYTGDSRPEIFFQKVAPIQIAWLGYPGSMGADAYDYAIADKTVLPEHHRSSFAEKIIYLPSTYQINDSERKISDRQFTREECGLPENGFVFCCFNNSYKITPVEFEIWMRLLRRSSNTVLWLLKCNSWVETNLKREAEKCGVDGSRLVFADRIPSAEHLARHRLADLFLDTFACNAHTTASDALWAGVPLVTKLGQQFAARVAASLLTAVGLPDLIVETAEEYEALALELCESPEKYDAIRDRLAQNRKTSPLFNTRDFTHNLEGAYLRVFQNFRDGLPAIDLHVGAPG